MDSRYRIKRGPSFVTHVEHESDDPEAGGWCGPLIMSRGHSRAGELPEAVICICCGDFCEGVDADTVATVDRLEASADRAEKAGENREKALDRLRGAGVDVAKLPVPVKRIRARRPVQLDLIGGRRG